MLSLDVAEDFINLQLPSSVTTIELEEVTVTRGDFLHHLTQLHTVKLNRMDLGDLQLPPSVTEVELFMVTVSVEAMLRLVESLEQTTHDVKYYVFQCIINPVDQIKRVNKRIQQSTCLKLNYGIRVDSESMVSFTLYTREKKQKKRKKGNGGCSNYHELLPRHNILTHKIPTAKVQAFQLSNSGS